MEKIAVVKAFRQLMTSCIDQLEKDGVKPQVVYKSYITNRNNLLSLIDGVTNRKEHLSLMVIVNKVYINPTMQSSTELLVKEFKKVLGKLPSAVNSFKDTNK